MKDLFALDSRAEQLLADMSQKRDIQDWRLDKEIYFDQFCDNWESLNLGRPPGKDRDRAVQEYGTLMDLGKHPPAAILWLNPDGYYEPCDGFLRLIAAEKRQGDKPFWAYVLECDQPNVIDRIRVLANVRLQGGHQPKKEWTLDQAIQLLIFPNKATIAQVADDGGWRPNAVRHRKNILEFRQAIESAGGPVMELGCLEAVVDTAKMQDVVQAPQVVAHFFSDLKKTKFTCEEARPYIRKFFDINRSRKIFNQLERRLRQFQEDELVRAALQSPKKRNVYTPEGKILKALKTSLTVAQEVLQDKEIVPSTEFHRFYQTLEQTKKTLRQIETASKR